MLTTSSQMGRSLDSGTINAPNNRDSPALARSTEAVNTYRKTKAAGTVFVARPRRRLCLTPPH
eukprot:4722542-Alexandrium_andersonii.AAC.1